MTTIASLLVSLKNSFRAAAGATGSSLQVARPFGPASRSSRPSRPSSSAAMRVSVFLITLYSTPCARNLRRRSVAFFTSSLLKDTRTTPWEASFSFISATMASFSGRILTSYFSSLIVHLLCYGILLFITLAKTTSHSARSCTGFAVLSLGRRATPFKMSYRRS